MFKHFQLSHPIFLFKFVHLHKKNSTFFPCIITQIPIKNEIKFFLTNFTVTNVLKIVFQSSRFHWIKSVQS